MAQEIAAPGLDAVLADPTKRLALERALFIIGEAANAVPQEIRAVIDQPWRDIIGLRHVLAHQYEAVETALLVGFAQQDAPRLVAAIESYLGQT